MSSMSMITMSSGAIPLEFEVGSAQFYMVVGTGSILALLTTCIIIIILCLTLGCVCLWRNRAST